MLLRFFQIWHKTGQSSMVIQYGLLICIVHDSVSSRPRCYELLLTRCYYYYKYMFLLIYYCNAYKINDLFYYSVYTSGKLQIKISSQLMLSLGWHCSCTSGGSQHFQRREGSKRRGLCGQWWHRSTMCSSGFMHMTNRWWSQPLTREDITSWAPLRERSIMSCCWWLEVKILNPSPSWGLIF